MNVLLLILSETLAFVDVFCEFLEVVVHSFFYYSKYYDHGTICRSSFMLVYFERRTKYKCMTYMCLVPDIVLYIHNLVQSVRPWIQRVWFDSRYYVKKQFHSIELEISTLEGTLLESMLIQASENTLSSSDLVDYSYVLICFMSPSSLKCHLITLCVQLLKSLSWRSCLVSLFLCFDDQ